MISNFEEKSWDIDIKNITVSHSQNTKCTLNDNSMGMKLILGPISTVCSWYCGRPAWDCLRGAAREGRCVEGVSGGLA